MGRPARGPALIADILAPQEGLHTVLGGLAIPDRIPARAGQVADRLVLDRRGIDRCAIPGAQQPGELHGVAAVHRDTVP
jgi:hypothetical protein